MNTTRLWTLGSILVIIALVAGTWFIGISPRLTEAATANADRSAAEAQNTVQAAKLAALEKQFESLDDLKEQLSELRDAVPADVAVPSLLRQLNALASSSGVSITNLALSSPTAFIPPAETPADPELSSALGSVSPETFWSIRFEVTVAGTHSSAMNFLSGLQSGERAALVTDFSLSEGMPSSGSGVEVTYIGELFVLLEPGAVVPAEGDAAVTQPEDSAVEDGATPQ